MIRNAKKIIGAVLTACAMLTTTISYAPVFDNSIIVSAATVNDNMNDYVRKDDSWFGTSESIEVADAIVNYQLSDGGWRRKMSDTSATNDWAKSSIDSHATWGQVRVLARVYNATGTEKYKTAALKGIDALIKNQYSNGGWPQIFGGSGYHSQITYTGNAMTGVLLVIRDCAYQTGDFAFIDSTYQAKAQTALEKGVDCILKTQIKSNGKLTGWCQQHDKNTLAPTTGLAHEPAAISCPETVNIVKFLRGIQGKSASVYAAIDAAIEWMYTAKVTNSSGSTTWARFYDISSNKPVFGDSDGKTYSDISQISSSLQSSYTWYGSWPSNFVAEYESNLMKSNAAVFADGTTVIMKNVNSGLYMDVADGIAANSTNIQQAELDGGTRNIFKLFSAGDGYYYIVSTVGDGATYVLDVAGRKTANKTNICLYEFNGGDNQQFMFTKNSDGSYKIRTKLTDANSCVEIIDALTESGANVQQHQVNGHFCQD